MTLLVHGPRAGITKPRKAAGFSRRTYRALLDGEILRPMWGAWDRRVDRAGDFVEDAKQNKRLVANIGDRLIVSNADVAVDEVAAVVVTAVEADGNGLRVRLLSGVVPTSRTAWVQRCNFESRKKMNVVKHALDQEPSPPTWESWESEADAAAAFDERIEKSGLFERVFKEVRGFYLAHRPGRDEKTARIDRVLIPGPQLRAAGWTATIGVELKKSDANFGAAVAQAIDYTYCNWNIGNYWMYCERIFLWPFAMPEGPLQSVMVQNGVGVAFGIRNERYPEVNRPLVFRLERNNIVVKPDGSLEECHASVSGKRKGSR